MKKQNETLGMILAFGAFGALFIVMSFVLSCLGGLWDLGTKLYNLIF